MDKALETMKKIFKKRGLEIGSIDDKIIPKKFIPLIVMVSTLQPGPDPKRIIVIVSHSSKDALLKDYIKYILDDATIHTILICNYDIPTTLKKMELLSNFTVEIFSVKELQIDILEHALQPIFTKISESISPKIKLPIMLRTDPVSRYLGCVPGDIISITSRESNMQNDAFGTSLRRVK